MIIKNLTEDEKEFKPIKFEITIENIDELKELWCRLNIGSHEIKQIQKHNKPSNWNTGNSSYSKIWNLLDNYLRDRT